MKINISSIDESQFMKHQHIINGQSCWLVQPQHIGAKFTQANKIFRSSLWNDEGELISAGFPKFTNWGENPDNFPVPTSLKNTTMVEKVDGSLLIVSKYKGNYILRTRGTSDATKINNGHELEIFKKDYLPNIKLTNEDSWDESYLFEWVSPLQKIILNYGTQPDWYLVGVVNHTDYSLWTQGALDVMAKELGLKRPVTYTFPSVEELMTNVEAWKGKEGLCVYSKDGQSIHKVKSAWYLALHRMKEEFGSIERLIDVWFSWSNPDYQTTEEKIISQFDYELFQTIRGDISIICDGWKDVQKIIAGMNVFVNETLSLMGNRKDQAMKTIASYGNTNRASFIFKMLDHKELTPDDKKKLLYQVLKK